MSYRSEPDQRGATEMFYPGPVTPHVLRLKAGEFESLLVFVKAIGIFGLVEWAWGILKPEQLPDNRAAWQPLLEASRNRDRYLLKDDLHSAWLDPATVRDMKEELSALNSAWTAATSIEAQDPEQMRREIAKNVLGFYWNPERLYTRFTVESGVFVEDPINVLARSWHELFDFMAEKARLPGLCKHCGTPYPKSREDQYFCTGACRRQYARRHQDNSEKRRDYTRMYRRMKRGQLTEDEFSEWLLQTHGRAYKPRSKEAG